MKSFDIEAGGLRRSPLTPCLGHGREDSDSHTEPEKKARCFVYCQAPPWNIKNSCRSGFVWTDRRIPTETTWVITE